MSSLLILSFTDLAQDARVSKQVRLLAGRYRVTAAGFADPRVPGVRFVPLPAEPRSPVGKLAAAGMLKLGCFERYYWAIHPVNHALRVLGNEDFDLILANDINTLPLACRLRSRHGILFDAHEYFPREFEDRPLWKFLFQRYYEYLCRTYLPKTQGMLTVCQSIADEYRNHYGVHPVVMMNTPPYHDLAPQPSQAGRIRLVHQGLAIESRKLELMIQMMDHLDERFHLDLFLMPSATRYFDRLVALAARHPRVRMMRPVPMVELSRELNRYDIGLYLVPPTNFNYRFVLPNKLFEFIQARLAVAIGPSPEMARVVQQYDCGIVSGDFEPRSLARQLNGLDARRIDDYKQRSHRAAVDLCFEKNAEILLGMIDRLLGAG